MSAHSKCWFRDVLFQARTLLSSTPASPPFPIHTGLNRIHRLVVRRSTVVLDTLLNLFYHACYQSIKICCSKEISFFLYNFSEVAHNAFWRLSLVDPSLHITPKMLNTVEVRKLRMAKQTLNLQPLSDSLGVLGSMRRCSMLYNYSRTDFFLQLLIEGIDDQSDHLFAVT